tara:strand:+ start:3626 stop:4060 length:435 start_codon:yes stop_codon:yes gene_type:complete
MAGEVVLPIQECPDMICHTIVVPVPDSVWDDDGSGASSTAAEGAFLFYCERDTIVDAAHFLCNTTDASGDITLNTASSGVAAAGTAISSALTPTAAGVVGTFTITETANLIPAGNWIGVEHDGDADSADLTGVMIQLRIRTRVR